MKKLLELDSPTYLRRLVREINASQSGAYTLTGNKVVSARFQKGAIHIRTTTSADVIPAGRFYDGNGQEITASRQPSAVSPE